MSARAVVAIGQPFVRRGGALSDPGVARDEISDLRAGAEPLVLRVGALGGTRAERALLAGDWLCDGGAEPVRIPMPSWRYDRGASTGWSSGRTWLDAWESCAEARWMLRAASDIGVARRWLVLAACACARTALPYVPAGDRRPLLAIEAAETWARSGLDQEAEKANVAAYAAARVAPSEYARAGNRGGAYHATAAADYATSYDYAHAAHHAAMAPNGTGWEIDREAMRRCAGLVRKNIPTVIVLRAATSR